MAISVKPGRRSKEKIVISDDIGGQVKKHNRVKIPFKVDWSAQGLMDDLEKVDTSLHLQFKINFSFSIIKQPHS